MSTRKSYITLITAPGIPTSEVAFLKAHYQKAINDPSYNVVVNYELRVDVIETPRKGKVLVIAPGIPASETKKLKLDVAKARTAKKLTERLVVCNYECVIDVVA